MTTRTTLPLFLLLWVSTWKLPDSSNRFVGAYLSLVFAELVVVAVEWCLLVSGMFLAGILLILIGLCGVFSMLMFDEFECLEISS